MSAETLFHRLGQVLETVSTSEKKNSAGRVKRYTKCRIKWDDNGETHFLDLSATYEAGQRTAVIYRGESLICDLNLATGERSIIGDRVEGLAALILVISVPLCFVLIGIPIYYGVTLYSKITTNSLRKRITAYLDDLPSRCDPAPAPTTA